MLILSIEKHEIEEKIFDSGFNLSNLEKAIDSSLEKALILPEIWDSSSLETKKMVFPEGILYDFKKGIYRTTRINSLFDTPVNINKIHHNKKRE